MTGTQRSRSLWVALLALSILFPLPAAAQERIGVVLMHGKWGSPSGHIESLAGALRSKGMLMATPVMPWGRGRDYDAGYPQAIEQIGAEVQALRQKGATRIVVAGHSFGANAALAYAASGAEVDGVAALAPGHTPDRKVFRDRLGASVGKARAMVAAGKGEERTSFDDLNQGKVATIWTSPNIYMSYFDPEGVGAMPISAGAIRKPTPFLWVVGTRDILHSAGPDYAYSKAPAHPKSKYLVVESDHLSTPRDATSEVLAWIEGLGK